MRGDLPSRQACSKASQTWSIKVISDRGADLDFSEGRSSLMSRVPGTRSRECDAACVRCCASSVAASRQSHRSCNSRTSRSRSAAVASSSRACSRRCPSSSMLASISGVGIPSPNCCRPGDGSSFGCRWKIDSPRTRPEPTLLADIAALLIDRLAHRHGNQHAPQVATIRDLRQSAMLGSVAETTKDTYGHILFVGHTARRGSQFLPSQMDQPIEVAVPDLRDGSLIAGLESANPTSYGIVLIHCPPILPASCAYSAGTCNLPAIVARPVPFRT